MAQHVEVNYDTLDGVKSTFDQQAQDIANMYSKISSQVQTLQGGKWKGRAATAFYNEMNQEILPAVKRLENAMNEASSTMAQISQMFHNAEDEIRDVWVPF